MSNEETNRKLAIIIQQNDEILRYQYEKKYKSEKQESSGNTQFGFLIGFCVFAILNMIYDMFKP